MKMSDALRAAAESAPVDDVHVATGVAASRVKRNRAIRAGANGVVGVGAAALVVAGIVGALANQSGVPMAEADAGVNRDDAAMDGGGAAPEPGIAGGIHLACGYQFDAASYPAGDVTAVATLGDLSGSTVPIDVAYSTTGDGAYSFDIPGVFVIWNGLVVGNPWVATDAATQTVTSGEPVTVSGTTDLVNCWDGAALPAGDYTIVTVTSLTDAATAPPVEEPTGEPSVEPAPLEPSANAVDPDSSVSSDAAGSTTDIADAPPTYAVSEAVELTIAGDPVKDPFLDYLNPTQPDVPATPDDALTSDAARAAYDAALAGRWDMAAGTQRVIKTGDGKEPTTDFWSQNYFGCPMDGASDSFPASSAELPWLDVTAGIPSSLSVSYGWVVDGNPLVSYSVKNTSEWSLPGFYKGMSPHLFLVKNGRVVAEAYPVNVDQNGGAIAYSTDGGADGEDAQLIYAPENDYLAPGEAREGEYLWRDVNGCWNGTAQASVEPGTYTLLSAQDIYIGGGYAVLEGDAAATERTMGSEGDDAVEPIIDPAPAPDQTDYVSFQVWTSHGTITVSN